MSLYQRILGHPFVYDRVRPLVVGGIDWSPLYERLDARPGDVILDVGCGTGIAQQYLRGFRAYYGFDTDPVAIDHARKHAGGPNITYECGLVSEREIARIQPTRIVLAGLLHHLSDDACVALLKMCAMSPALERVVTSDVTYLPGELISNLFAYFDRGKFVRKPHQYLELIARAGLRLRRDDIVRSHPTTGKALYLMTVLEPGAPSAS